MSTGGPKVRPPSLEAMIGFSSLWVLLENPLAPAHIDVGGVLGINRPDHPLVVGVGLAFGDLQGGGGDEAALAVRFKRSSQR